MGWRALLGAASIAVVGLIEWRSGRLDNPLGFGALSPVVALLAMIAISAYTASVMTTTIADVMVIYATMPFVAAAMGFLINGERVSARTLIASGLALIGIIIMVASGLGSGRLLGQALSMLMTLAFAGMIVLQRRQPGASVIIVNCLGAIGSGIFGLANSPLQPISLHDFAILFVFGLTTIGLAFVLFMEGAKFIPSAEADRRQAEDEQDREIVQADWLKRRVGEAEDSRPRWPQGSSPTPRRPAGASVIIVNCLGAIGSGIFGLANSPLQPISLHDFAILFVFGLTTIGLRRWNELGPLHEEDEGEADRRQAEDEQDREIVQADWLKRRVGEAEDSERGSAPRQFTIITEAPGWRRCRTIMPAKASDTESRETACARRGPYTR